MQALVSIITVNYNQAQVTCALLESLRSITYKPIEIFVVDNASTEDCACIAQQYPEVTLIRSKENLGFAGGNNLAVRKAQGAFLLFINNDTEVHPGFLEPLVAKLQHDESIGMVSPKIRFFDAPKVIQYAGYHPINPYTLQQHLVGYKQQDVGQFDKSGETYSVHGAAMCMPYAVVEKVGMMAEVYFLYYEEHDWAHRIKQAGYKAWYVADSLVYHKESVTTGKDSPLKTHYMARNRILFARRNYKGFTFAVNMLFVHAVSFPKNMLKFLLSGRYDLAKAYLTGFGWNLKKHSNIHQSPKLK